VADVRASSLVVSWSSSSSLVARRPLSPGGELD
jgi:hypothetical protein